MMGQKGELMESLHGDEGIEDLRNLFWSIQTSEALMEAVVKHARSTSYPMACDTNMDHDPLRQRKWFNDRSTLVGTPANNLSTCKITVEGSVTVGRVFHDIVF